MNAPQFVKGTVQKLKSISAKVTIEGGIRDNL